MAAGDFTASDLGVIKAKMSEMFTGDRFSEVKKRPAFTAQALLERQTVSFSPVEVGGECRGVEAIFLKHCSSVAADTSGLSLTDCDIPGLETETAKSTFNIDDGVYTVFALDVDECNKDLYSEGEKLAFLMLTHALDLEVLMNDKVITFLDANATDFNGETLKYGVVNATTTMIDFADSDWDASIIGKLLWNAEQYETYNPFLVDSGNLWLEEFTNRFKNGCCTIDTINNAVDVVYDTRKMVAPTVDANSTFAIDPDSYAFWQKNRFLNTVPQPVGGGDQHNTWGWRMPLPRLRYSDGGTMKPVYADVYRQTKCTGNMQWKYHFMMKVDFALSLAPDVCQTGNSGIIHYRNSG